MGAQRPEGFYLTWMGKASQARWLWTEWGGRAFPAGINPGRGPEASEVLGVFCSLVCGGWDGDETREVGRGPIEKALECLSVELSLRHWGAKDGC